MSVVLPLLAFGKFVNVNRNAELMTAAHKFIHILCKYGVNRLLSFN